MVDLPAEALADLTKLPERQRQAIINALREHSDNRGKGFLEVTNTPPMAGSRRYPWLRKSR